MSLQPSSANSPAIELREISRKFLSPEGKAFTTLINFSMRVERGEFVALVGPTGCGKSTTLNLITGLGKPTSGEVRVMGHPVNGIDPRVGFVFQSDALFPWKSVIANVMAGPLFRGRPKSEVESLALNWLRRVGLSKFAQHYPHQLSGGMRKRVALAQTFINNPEILLMDEPFSALDAQTRILMHEELLDLWSITKSAVVFVTHDLEEAIALADRVLVLTARPASIKSEHIIDIPRPRNVNELRYQKDFIEISRKIWEDLRDEVRHGSDAA
jgi:NitT/TauT family transport system ATP-binding protein